VTKPLLLWTGCFTLKLESLVRTPYGLFRSCGVFRLATTIPFSWSPPAGACQFKSGTSPSNRARLRC